MAKTEKPEEITGSEKPKDTSYLNEGIDLSKFTYKGKFEGEHFKAYIEMVEGKRDEETGAIVEAGKIAHDQLCDFVVVKAVAIRKKAYPLLKDSPYVLTGMEIISADHETKTRRTTLGRALTMNGQLPHTLAKTHPMEYYLLAKPKA